MNNVDEVRWRLRKGQRIVGYERQASARIWSSADGLWWGGRRLECTDKDRGMPCKDINNQWLYDKDVVTWDKHSGTWILLSVGDRWLLTQGERTLPAPLTPRTLRRVAFAFPKD
jgi:hypothetical protein